MNRRRTILYSILLVASGIMQAQDKSDGELAKATQNPLAAMISLPFQNNTSYNIGPHKRAQNILNIQPVIPASISEKYNLINRVIAPIITQPSSFEDNSTSGLGDINYTAWVSPKKAGKIIPGIGPVFQLPTASSKSLGSKEFGIGPSIVALSMIDKWVGGIVVNNIWTFGDVSENKFLFQYFVNYNLPKAWYLVSGPIITANWNATESNKWIVPFGGGAGKVFRIGKQPININAHLYYNAVRPDGWAKVQSRLQVQFLFPTKKS
ncbi:hypothetical protein [Saccharicrinis aurantiacus]|uniref:hypothetical protein n=1 Tax=Saccharicrinis aurantiacus TaxID=1849719 RepID=UPI00249357C6|nr:hypothetical protein [Saccharicrinis aurantiacus]